MEEINFLRAYRAYLELYQTYLDRSPRIDEIYISDGRRLPEDSDGGIYQFNLTESEFLRLDKMMSGELKVLINEQEYENEILSFDKESIVIRLKGVRDRRIERVCFAGDAEFLKRITEKQIGILETLHENQNKRNILFGNFEGAERVPCSFEDNRVEQEQRQRDAVEFSVGVKDLFLIWGPPGTGKSTIVLEIIRNYLARNSDAKILVCSYANGAVDRIVEIICEDTNLRQKIVRVGPCQIKEEYSGIKLVEILNNVFKGVINRIKSYKERLTELDKEEREHIDDARERIRGEILALENEIGALKGEERSLRNHKWLIGNEISESEDAIIRLKDKEMILDGKIASLEEEREKIKHLSKIVEIYLSFAERMVPWLRRRNFRRDPRYISYRSMIDRFNLENLTRDELGSLERSNQKKMEEVKRSLSELQSSLEGVSEERIGRENEIGDSRRKLRAVEEEIKAKQRKESDLEDEKAKLEDSLNANANEMLPLIRRLNIIAKERFNRLERIIKGIVTERGVISREIKSLKERISSSRRLSNNPKLEEKERQIELQIQKEAKFLAPKAITGQPRRGDQEKEILNRKQIIATTNLKLLTSLFDDLHFDLAIMDEAGFTDLPAALGPFVKADKLILIGDHKQLQPIIQEKGYFEKHIQQYPFIKKSIFELFWEKRQSENKGIMLNKQHRMKKEIASFISKEFYDDELMTGLIGERSNTRDTEDPTISFRCPLVFINISAGEVQERKSWFCTGEIEVVKRIVKKFAAEHTDEAIYDEIGVITPYRPQNNRMKDKLPKKVACGTVHVFQGHEKPVIVYSTVRQNEEKGRRSPPLLDERLLNVAVSRAMHKFILVGNTEVLHQLPYYRAFIDHARRNGQVYEEIPKGYDYTNRCEYCGRPIEKKWRFCWNCNEAINYEKENGGLIQFIDGMIVRTRGEMSAGDGHWVRSEGEKQIDIWFQEHKIDEHSINHGYEMDVRKYLFSMDEKSERDLSEGNISGRLRLRRIFRKNGVLLSGDAVVARTREENEREISDYENKETYSIEKKGEKRKVYKKSRIPMWCDWYLPDYDIYVEYWGMMGDTHYQRRREKKEAEYERLQLKILSIGSENLGNVLTCS